MSYSRRNFIKAAGAVMAGTFSAPYISTTSKADASGNGIPLKIIHFVADGASPSMVTIADKYSKMVLGYGLRGLDLGRLPNAHTAFMNTSSLNSLVTDSSAASSAWGSGRKVANGAVNCYPDGSLLTPLYKLFREAGWKLGLVTNSMISDATPAGFAAATSNRFDPTPIIQSYLDLGIEVLLGGGQNFYTLDILTQYLQAGYEVVSTAEQLKNAPVGKKILGLFSEVRMPMYIDWLHDAEQQAKVPSLPEMTRQALNRLSESDRFILQVENQLVDHLCHQCDAAGAVYDYLSFDDAVQVGIEYQQEHPETLLIVTSDHGCGGISLNGSGDIYTASSTLLPNLQHADGSFITLLPLLQECTNTVQVQMFLKEHYGADVSADKANLLLLAGGGYNSVANDLLVSLRAQLGQVLSNYCGVSWGSVNHSGDHTLLIANGPGSERFQGPIDNTDIFNNYVDIAGINFRNPEWSGRGKVDITNRVLDEHGRLVAINIKYEGVLEQSTDLVHWEDVTDASGGTYLVNVQDGGQRFFRYRSE